MQQRNPRLATSGFRSKLFKLAKVFSSQPQFVQAFNFGRVWLTPKWFLGEISPVNNLKLAFPNCKTQEFEFTGKSVAMGGRTKKKRNKWNKNNDVSNPKSWKIHFEGCLVVKTRWDPTILPQRSDPPYPTFSRSTLIFNFVLFSTLF